MTTSVATCWPATASRPETASTRTRLPTPSGKRSRGRSRTPARRAGHEQGQREGHDAERRADAEHDDGATCRDLVDGGRGVDGERAVGEVGRDDDEARQQGRECRADEPVVRLQHPGHDDRHAVERDLDREDPAAGPCRARPRRRTPYRAARRRSGGRRARRRHRGARARQPPRSSSADAVASAPARSPRASAPATRGTATAASTPPAAISKSTLGTALTDW